MAFNEEYSESLQVDHIDGNRSNNVPENLRMVTKTENSRSYNRPTVGASSKFRGVNWFKRGKVWMAGIRVDGKQHHLGNFQKELDAAMAYDNAAISFGFSKEALNIK